MAKADITGRLNLDSTGFERGIQRSKQSVKGFAKSSMATFVRMGAAFAGIGLVKSIVGLGTAAAETASKFNAVFGSAADAMNEKVQELRKTIPSTTEEMQGALATFAQMAKAFGLNSEAANLFSVEMVKIAGDIASFNNLPIEDAFTKIRSAISGEFEPMKSLGIVINEARLKQEALNLAIWDGTGQMSAAQKALAVQAILIKDMGDANGDAALTANSAANQIKFLQKSLKETGTEIGVTMLPAIATLTEAFAKLLGLAKSTMEAVGTSLGELVYGDQDRVQAGYDLAAQGITQGKGRGGAVKYEKAIQDQIKKNKEAADAAKIAAQEKRKADEEAIKNAGDLKSELKSQIETETDPARKKALEDRLESYKNLIKAAGKLESLQGAKPGTSGGTGSTGTGGSGTGGSDKKFAAGDTNQSGYVTPREQRAAESQQRKEDQARRAREKAERSAEIGASEIERQKQRDQRMTERERGAGLYLAGGDPMSGRSPSGMKAGEGEKKDKSEQQIEQLKEVNKKLSKLDGALSGDN
jgi:hypothetical protein